MKNIASATQCFVIMPFSDTKHGKSPNDVTITKAQWDHIYKSWISRALETYPDEPIRAKRSPAQPGNFIRGIVNDLAESPLVIADLTGAKSNVYYELGIRHSLRTGTIVITQDLSSVPSDLRNYYAFEYTYTEKAHEYESCFMQFASDLHAKIRAFTTGEVISDSPVSDFLGLRAHIAEANARQNIAEMRQLLLSFKQASLDCVKAVNIIAKVVSGGKLSSLAEYPVIDTFLLESIYLRIHGIRWPGFEATIKALSNVITKYRRMFQGLELQWQMLQWNPDPGLIAVFVGMASAVDKVVKKQLNTDFTLVEQSLNEVKLSLVFTNRKGKVKTIQTRRID